MNYDILEEIAKFGDLSLKYKNIHVNNIDPEKLQQVRFILKSIVNMSYENKKKVGSARSWVQIGRVFDKLEDSLSQTCFRIAILHDLNFAPAWYFLGVSLKDEKEKEKCFRKAVEVDPTNSIAWHYLGAFLMNDKEREQCFQKAIELDPTNSIAWNNLGSVKKNEAEKESCFRKAIELDPDNETAWFNLGILLYDEDLVERARQLGYQGWIPNSSH